MKNFSVEFLNNGIVAVCENIEEAIYARQNGAAGLLLVKERGGEHEDVFVMADEGFIENVLEEVQIPVFVRVKFGHFGEAKICEGLGVDGISEGFQVENSLDKKLNPEEFDFPIISEVFDPEKISEANENILILGDYATGNFNSIKEKFLEIFCHCEEGNDVAIQSNDTEKEKNNNLGKNNLSLGKNGNIALDCVEFMPGTGTALAMTKGKNIFLGGGISSVADLDVLQGIGNVKGFFVGSAIFDLDSEEFFEDYWEYKKNIFN